MTNPDYTAIAILVDRSGSMQKVRADAEGGINAFVADQRQVPGKCTVRLSEFDSLYDVVYASTPIAEVPDYRLIPRGSTALRDAIGQLVTDFGQELAAMPEDERPGTVIVVVQTDGAENSSTEWAHDAIHELINAQRAQYNWQFVFLGADQDAIQTGVAMGFDRGSSISYAGTRVGTQSVFSGVSSAVLRSRAGGQSVVFTDDERTAAQQQ